MNSLPLRILLLAGSAAFHDGALLGIEEAARTSTMFGVSAPQLVVLDPSHLPASLPNFTALVTSDPASCAHLPKLARESHAIVMGAGCPHYPEADACAPGVFRIAAADSGTVLWDASLEAFGAAQLNERFRQRFGRPMSSEAWAGWMAIKTITEAALRTRSVAPDSLVAYLAQSGARFDGHKGVALSFGPSHEMTSPVYRMDAPPNARVLAPAAPAAPAAPRAACP